MTYQPPPPPPPPGGAPPPPPSGGQYGPPAGGYPSPGGSSQYPTGGGFQPSGGGQPGAGGSKSSFDPKSVNPLDWALLGIGLLVFIFSLFSFYSASASGGGVDASEGFSAWHDIFGGGFFAWLGVIAAIVAAIVLAIALFAPHVKMPVAARLAVFGLFALAAICEILAIFLHPKFYDGSGGSGAFKYSLSFGHGFSFWIVLILTIAGAVLALMRLQATGGTLPGALANMPNIGHLGPQGGNPGQTGIGSGSGSAGYAPPGGGNYAPPAGGYGAPAPGAGAPPAPGGGMPPSPGPGSPPPGEYGPPR